MSESELKPSDAGEVGEAGEPAPADEATARSGGVTETVEGTAEGTVTAPDRTPAAAAPEASTADDEPTPALRVSAVRHAFKKHQALDGISFEVPDGSIHGFVGPNGAGKTTTLKIISTLLEPDEGRVEVFGHDVVSERYKVRAMIGLMPDHFSMYQQMRVVEYLDFFGAAYGLGTAERDQIIGDVLALTDMDGRRNDFISGLSRGMQQRVSLARVLVNDPKLLLLDEPASGLDPRARIELMEILRELRSMGKTIFISSHILSELADLCDSVTIIDQGTIKYSGTMTRLLDLGGATRAVELTLLTPSEPVWSALRDLEGVQSIELLDEEELRARVHYDPAELDNSALLSAALAAGAAVGDFRESLKQLNQVFMDLTEPGVRE